MAGVNLTPRLRESLMRGNRHQPITGNVLPRALNPAGRSSFFPLIRSLAAARDRFPLSWTHPDLKLKGVSEFAFDSTTIFQNGDPAAYCSVGSRFERIVRNRRPTEASNELLSVH